MKRFLNRWETLVQDAVSGMIAVSGGRLGRLDGYPDIKVVVRTDWRKEKVAVISGGGSGHEPAHAGFVGPGLLTAAVCGEVFASPSVEAVLAAIRFVTGDAGCLLVVKNYTGDRLNFGLAAERARSEGLKVKMLVVADDVSLPGSAQPRGIAGTLFVHKVAGYVAEQGQALDQVAQAAREVAGAVRSLGLALTTCHPPGSDKERLGTDEAEIGLGIHGEPGVERFPLGAASELVKRVCRELERGLPAGRLAVMLNNLGAVPPLEMALLSRAVLDTELGARASLFLGPAHLMTSYDMNGFSVSVLPLDERVEEALTAHVACSSWPQAVRMEEAPIFPLPEQREYPLEASNDPLIRTRLLAICTILKEARQRLNSLDAKVGDGDAGDTLFAAAVAVEAELDGLPLADPPRLLVAISRILSQTTGGSSGALLSILTQAAAREFTKDNWAKALLAGARSMMEYGGAALGDRTMLDVLVPALEALDAGRPLSEIAVLADERARATASVEKTSSGRSSYLGADNLRGIEDPGARAAALAFQALLN